MSDKKGNHLRTEFELAWESLLIHLGPVTVFGYTNFPNRMTPGEIPEATITIIPTETKDAPETVQQASEEIHEPTPDGSDGDTQRQ